MKRILILSVCLLLILPFSTISAANGDAIQIGELSKEESVFLKSAESQTPLRVQAQAPGWGDTLKYYTLSLRSAVIVEPVYIGCKWPSAEMSSFDGWKIDRIRFLMLLAGQVDTMLLYIWQSDQIDAPVYTQKITDIKNGLNTIVFNQKLIIDGTSDFYVGFYLVPKEESLFILPTGKEGVNQQSNLFMNPLDHTAWSVKNYKFGKATLAWPISVLIAPNSPVVTPEVVNWGPLTVGAKKDRLVNIENTALKDIIVSKIQLVDNYINGFSVNYPALPLTISGGSDQDFEVSFHPEIYGPYLATCQVITSYPPDTMNVTLKGGGGDYAILNMNVDQYWRGTTSPPAGKSYFPYGAVVPIQAIPNPEIIFDTRYLFKSWTGSVEDSLSADTYIVMDSHKYVIANFKSARFTLTTLADPPGAGQIIVDPDTIDYKTRTPITLLAVPDSNYHFTHWQCGDSLLTGNDTLVIVIETDTTVTAVFEPDTLVAPEMAFAYPSDNTEYVPSNSSIQFGIQKHIFTLDPSSFSFSVNGKAIVNEGVPVSDSLDISLNCSDSFIQVAYFPGDLPENKSVQVDLAFSHHKMSDKPLEKSFRFNTYLPVSAKLHKLPLDNTPMSFEWIGKDMALDIFEETVLFPFVLHWGEVSFLGWTLPDGMADPEKLFYFGPSGVPFNEPLILTLPPAIAIENPPQSILNWAVYYCPYQGAEWELVLEMPMNGSIREIPVKTTGWYLLGNEAVTTGIETTPVDDFALHGNYPNPFNPETQIRFDLPVLSRVTLTVYNNLGQVIRTLINQDMEAGHHSEKWDGTDNQGHMTSSGIYIIEMCAQDKIFRNKMMLIR